MKNVNKIIKDYVNKEYTVSVPNQHKYLNKICKKFDLNSFEEIQEFIIENNKQNWLKILGMSQTGKVRGWK